MDHYKNELREMGGGRASNIELYRIIVMLLIVAHHYFVNSGLRFILTDVPNSGLAIFYTLFGAWGKTGINCFVLITGYYMCKRNISLRKFLKLVIAVIFYNVIIYSVFVVTGYSALSLKEAIVTLLPIKGCNDGFTSAFILFYLAIPFLNILLEALNKKTHGLLLLLLLFIYTIMPLLMAKVTFNYFSWFGVLYLIASYIRLYGLPHNDSPKFWGWLTLATVVVSSVSIISLYFVFHRGIYFFVSDSNSIMALVLSISSFMFFKNIKIKYNRGINAIAATTFGVLLIHANSDTMRNFLWYDLFDNLGHYAKPLYAVAVVLIVFTICACIEYTRIKTIEKPLLNAAEKGCLLLKERFMVIRTKYADKLR